MQFGKDRQIAKVDATCFPFLRWPIVRYGQAHFGKPCETRSFEVGEWFDLGEAFRRYTQAFDVLPYSWGLVHRSGKPHGDMMIPRLRYVSQGRDDVYLGVEYRHHDGSEPLARRAD